MEKFTTNILKAVFTAENSLYEDDPIGKELGSLIYKAVQFKQAISNLDNAIEACDCHSEEDQALRKKMRGTKYAIENVLRDLNRYIEYLRDYQLSKEDTPSMPIDEQVERDIREFLEKGNK